MRVLEFRAAGSRRRGILVRKGWSLDLVPRGPAPAIPSLGNLALSASAIVENSPNGTVVGTGAGPFFAGLQGGAATGPTALVEQGGGAGRGRPGAVSGLGPSEGNTPGEPTLGPIRTVSAGGRRSAPTT